MKHQLPTCIPGSDLPAQQPKAAQLRAIRARAKASEAVVNLLCRLAYGDRDDDWPPHAFGPPLHMPTRHHHGMHQVPA